MDLRNLEFLSFYCIYSRLPRNGVGGVHVFHECLPTSSTKTYPKVTTFRKGRRDGHPVAPTLSAQKAPFEDCVLGGRGLPMPLYSGLGNSLNPSFLRDVPCMRSAMGRLKVIEDDSTSPYTPPAP